MAEKFLLFLFIFPCENSPIFLNQNLKQNGFEKGQ